MSHTGITHTHSCGIMLIQQIHSIEQKIMRLHMHSEVFVVYAFCRERLLLVDPDNSPAASKQLVALVVGHELAHQWFGNLVS